MAYMIGQKVKIKIGAGFTFDGLPAIVMASKGGHYQVTVEGDELYNNNYSPGTEWSVCEESLEAILEQDVRPVAPRKYKIGDRITVVGTYAGIGVITKVCDDPDDTQPYKYRRDGGSELWIHESDISGLVNPPEQEILKSDHIQDLPHLTQEFVIKDSGQRQSFDTGAVRDTSQGKGRYDLLPTHAILRLARHYEGGAAKYGDDNWLKGMPMRRMLESAMRHLFKAAEGQTDEDHFIAAAWNILGIVEYQERIKEGLLPADLDNLPKLKQV